MFTQTFCFTISLWSHYASGSNNKVPKCAFSQLVKHKSCTARIKRDCLEKFVESKQWWIVKFTGIDYCIQKTHEMPTKTPKTNPPTLTNQRTNQPPTQPTNQPTTQPPNHPTNPTQPNQSSQSNPTSPTQLTKQSTKPNPLLPLLRA